MRRLYDFLAAKSMPAAQKAMKAIQQGVKTIQSNPALGRILAEEHSEYREWIVAFGRSAYIVRYRFSEQHIAILAVRHGREAGY